MMTKSTVIALLFATCSFNNLLAQVKKQLWSIGAIPSSVRIDPTSNKIIGDRFYIKRAGAQSLLKKNWIYDGNTVKLFGAKGEYISFQVVLTNYSEASLKGIEIQMTSLENNKAELNSIRNYSWNGLLRLKRRARGIPGLLWGKGGIPTH